MHLLSAITQAPYPRAMTALVAATLALLIDLILRFRDYRALLNSLSVAGIMKFLGTFMLVFLQVVALYYLITLLPGPLRAVVLLFFAFVVVIQLSYWLTLSQFMTGTDLFLALTVSGDHRVAAILSFFKPLVFLYALPYILVLSVLIFVPPGYAIRETLLLSLLPALFLLASNYALFRHVPERSFHLNPLTSFLRSALQCKFESLREYHGLRDDLPPFHASHRPHDSIIYVIDESVRGSNLSLNGYPPDTLLFQPKSMTADELISGFARLNRQVYSFDAMIKRFLGMNPWKRTLLGCQAYAGINLATRKRYFKGLSNLQPFAGASNGMGTH
jgi:glucan phosphoethanolaminetransferase (alkaline phosphatase superfamily)